MENTTPVQDIARDDYNPNQLVTYKVIDLDSPTNIAHFPTSKVVDIEWQLEEGRRLQNKVNKLQGTINSIIDMLSADNYYSDDHDKDSILNDLCETLGHNPKKTFNFSAQVTVTGSIDVELSSINDFDLADALSDTLSIDAWNGDVVIDGFEIDSVDENY